VLRSLGQSVPDTPANAILEAYLHILEREGNDHLVAMYAACLREGNGEDSYARFLRSECGATRRRRRLLLAVLRCKGSDQITNRF
jgi:nuclear pore complex protein Nup107